MKPDKQYNNWAGQHSDENGPFEVFWHDVLAGWYWCPCSPDGEAMGPFNTSLAAYNDAKADGYDNLPEYTEPAKYGNT